MQGGIEMRRLHAMFALEKHVPTISLEMYLFVRRLDMFTFVMILAKKYARKVFDICLREM